jgi:hypothetical protein
MFIRMEDENDAPWKKGKETTLMNLQMVNFALYHDEQQRQRTGFIEDESGWKCWHPDKAPPGLIVSSEETNDLGFYNLACLRQANKTYQFIGTCINEGAPFTVDDPQTGGGQNSRRRRLINVCIRGRQSTFNVWGDIRDGDQLYLKFVKRTVKGADFNLDVESQSTMDGPELSCYQLVPERPDILANRPRYTYQASYAKTLNDDEDTSEAAPTHHINIGRCFRTQRHLKMDNSQFGDRVRSNMSRQLTRMITTCPQFEILVDPCVM